MPPSESVSLYEVLGADRSATHEELRAAYRHTAKHSTPDALYGVNAAMEILGNPQQRAAYDAALRHAAPPLPKDVLQELFALPLAAGKAAFSQVTAWAASLIKAQRRAEPGVHNTTLARRMTEQLEGIYKRNPSPTAHFCAMLRTLEEGYRQALSRPQTQEDTTSTTDDRIFATTASAAHWSHSRSR